MVNLGGVAWARSDLDPTDASPVAALERWGLTVEHPVTGAVTAVTSDGQRETRASVSEAWHRATTESDTLVLWAGADVAAGVSIDNGLLKIDLDGLSWPDAVAAVHSVVGAATTDPDTVVVVADRHLADRTDLWIDYVSGARALPCEPDLLFEPGEGGSGAYRLRLSLDSWLNHPFLATLG